MDVSIGGPLRAGLVLYATGEYHAAHDPWEEVWLELETGTDDEKLFHGLIQLTAAIHHARNRNWSGAVGLAESGREYLDDLPNRYRGVAVGDAVAFLNALARDPERIERGPPDPISYREDVLEVTDLPFEELVPAVDALAEEYETYEGDILAEAIEVAREEQADGRAAITTLLFDFVAGEDPSREFVYDQLAARIRRRRRKRDDVSGLFET
ncbi:putative metal-dependent hydrolase [Halalkaliarchaeum sp. AArc-CO]|uniref:DUF309 domain-containing protein n=1 Tax=unclassified Halalkaliarchaeum TaxID=2678344 RepID=UPI00217D4F80|nr:MULTISPECIES: DUF309 domain-containing protein [unclassified Halalkaliarchaeum]MDR5672752.1 DUF309 domain-containing protein [Halalkaliarchaeum sp. AArc-GB]UWG49342.1 putative metal-dependent hydrolase [Halalkaliarchaeum sp. AArc-CO]